MKSDLKSKAVEMRKEGASYSEILKEVPVARSTLSLWLREARLSKPQQQRITKKRREAAQKGGKAKHEQRLKRTKEIHKSAEKEVGEISERELWLMGTMLYWAEGSKEKTHMRGTNVELSNSDPYLIKLFIRWLLECCEVDEKDVQLRLYIHDNHKHRLEEVIHYWTWHTGFSRDKISYIYFKKHNAKTKRKNTGSGYYGNLVVKIKASSELNRKIHGWVQGVLKNYWGVV